MVNLTVIIPNYNGKHFLKECFESLKNQNYSFDVIIVDNASKDGSTEYIKKNYPEFILIENKENLGFSAAVNQGIRLSKTEYVFLLNNDVELESDCVYNMVKCLENRKNLFAVTSKMIQYHDHDKIDDAGDEYTLLGWTKRVGYDKSSNRYNTRREVFSACGGAALYRKRILDEIGLFDENFFAYMEDVDLSYRARIHGYHISYCPDAIIYHRGSGTSGSRYNEFKIKLAARNNIYVPYKNMPLPQLILNSPFLILGFIIKYLFFRKKGYGKTYLKGLNEGINSLDNIKKVKYSGNMATYFKIEWLLIKNTIKFLFF